MALLWCVCEKARGHVFLATKPSVASRPIFMIPGRKRPRPISLSHHHLA